MLSAVAGQVSFTDLIIGDVGSALALRFFLPSPGTDLAEPPAPVFSLSDKFNVESLDVVHLRITQEPAGARAGGAFTTQPVVELLDYEMVVRPEAAFSVVAQLVRFDPTTDRSDVLQGTLADADSNRVIVVAAAGVATFTDLRMDLATSGYVCVTNGVKYDSEGAC